MGLIASIFAYLSGVAVLVAVLLMTFDALLYPSNQTTAGEQIVAAAANRSGSQAASPVVTGSVRPASSDAQARSDDAQAQSANAVSQTPRVHRLVRRSRPGSLAFQQGPKASGYAEEPSASFLYDRFQ
jgi:hypothetical protein